MFKRFKAQPAPVVKPKAAIEYRRMPSFSAAAAEAGKGYLNEAALSDLQKSWFYQGEPRLTDLPDFFGPFFAVMGLAASKPGPIRVLDFGGAIGRYGAYADAFFSRPFEWTVVETPMYAEEGKRRGLPVTFHTSLDELSGPVDVAIFSGVLQYIEGWKDILAHRAVASSGLVFITRTPIASEAIPFLQTVQHDSGEVMMPATVLDWASIDAVLSPTHSLFSSFALEQHLGEIGVISSPSMIWRRY